MEVRKYQEEHFASLFSYWKNLGKQIPYFFRVTPAKWRQCMFDDKFDHEKMFSSLRTFVAEENGQILGFIQCGQPAFAWDETGQKYHHPSLGIIRHFYFDPTRLDVANLLFAHVKGYLEQFSGQHAFYHIFGMSCNAYHGKLHQSLDHVAQFLYAKGYRVEHENLYYSLELKQGDLPLQNELYLISKPDSKPTLREYEIYLRATSIGSFQFRCLEKLTGGATCDTAYLTWMGINPSERGQGWGKKALQILCANLQRAGYNQVHLDTARANERAQQFYDHYGFQNRGRTRSFIRTVP